MSDIGLRLSLKSVSQQQDE